jgi:SecD/SecF fusion protein
MYENYRWKFGLTAFFGALALWGLVVTPLNLGLDLQGGAQLIYRLEIQELGSIGVQVRAPKQAEKDKKGLYVESTITDSPADKAGLKIGDIIKKVGKFHQDSESTFTRLIQREKSGSKLSITFWSKLANKIKTAEVEVRTQEKSTAKLADNVIEVLKKRLDGFGLREMTIQKQGRLGIIIQVPGVNKTELKQIEDIVRRGGKMAFKIVADDSSGVKRDEQEKNIKRIFSEKAQGIYSNDDPFDIALNKERLDSLKRKIVNLKPEEAPDFYILLKNPGVSGDHLSDSYRTVTEGRPAIGFSWSAFGAKKFYKMTSENIQKSMCVSLDGIIQQTATIQSGISNQGVITGKFSEEDIRKVVVVLKGGALQAKPILQSKEQVGPSIGRASLTIGKWSIGVATVMVLLFMFLFYKGSGAIANAALMLNLVLILGILTIFEATLTLPGIAGILLTAGMAVDANILIFERIREEIEKEAGLKQAIQAGYERAFWTIFDANLTTLITAFILFKAGTGPIKGFAVTLMVGIICSMFTALFVTRALYGWLVSAEFLTEMKMNRVLDKTNFNFMSQRAKWGMISLVCINVGFIVFGLRGNEKYGIDFTGGSMVAIAFESPLNVSDVKESIDKNEALKNKVSVTMTGKATEEKGYFFTLKTREVAEKIVQNASKEGEDGGNEPKNTAQDAFKLKIEELFRDKLIESQLAKNGQRYRVIDAPVKMDPIKKVNLNQGKKALVFGVIIQRPGTFDDYKFTPDPKNPTQNEKFIALVQSTLRGAKRGTIALSAGEGLTVIEKQNDVAKPYVVYEITTGGILANKASYDASFEGLNTYLEDSKEFNTASNFMQDSTIGAAIAYNLKSKALISLFFSLIAIVMYITIRFEFRFGVAAIAALIHDVLFAIGFMAILDSVFSGLGVQFDSKINLPTVAAFLTIIGYSLNDTIVVFDRIRENMKSRKMKGVKQEELVNTSINQTLSRTILTSLTTFFVVFILFVASFFGLASIQGLSVALLVGVVVGTYSSIFVASSTLLMDSESLNKLFLGQGLALVVIWVGTSYLYSSGVLG